MENESDFVSAIRGITRQQFQHGVKEHRHERFAVRRRGIDEGEKASHVCTPVEVKELAAQMKHKSGNSLLACKRIRQSLGQNQESVKAFLQTEGSLQHLVVALTSSDASLQIEAACCVANIGLWGGKASSTCAKATGHYLLTFVNTHLPNIQEACVWALTNLLPECLKFIALNDLLPCLIRALSSPHDNVVEAVLDCLNRLIMTSHDMLKQGSVMVPLAKEAVLLINQSSKEYIQLLAWLFYFCSFADQCLPVLVQSGIVPWAVGNLCDESKNQINPHHRTVIPLVRLLANLCAEDESCVRELLYHVQCLPLLNGLLEYSFLCVRKETVWLVGNVMNQASEDVQTLLSDMQIEYNLKPKLLPMLAFMEESHGSSSMDLF